MINNEPNGYKRISDVLKYIATLKQEKALKSKARPFKKESNGGSRQKRSLKKTL